MMTPSLMVVASIIAIAVENVSEKSILPCPIFHRPNVTTGLLYRVFTDNVFACKRTKKKMELYRMWNSNTRNVWLEATNNFPFLSFFLAKGFNRELFYAFSLSFFLNEDLSKVNLFESN